MTERVGLHMTGWTRPATVTKKSYNAVTNRKMQKVVVDVTGNGAFVRIYQGHLIVGRHTF
ncbi:MAG: hypothetical protein ACLSBF_00340 [Alphaproteobacteria bacterium]